MTTPYLQCIVDAHTFLPMLKPSNPKHALDCTYVLGTVNRGKIELASYQLKSHAKAPTVYDRLLTVVPIPLIWPKCLKNAFYSNPPPEPRVPQHSSGCSPLSGNQCPSDKRNCRLSKTREPHLAAESHFFNFERPDLGRWGDQGLKVKQSSHRILQQPH